MGVDAEPLPDTLPDTLRVDTLRVDIVTIFPDMVRQAAGHSIIGRAQTSGRIDLRVHDLRHWSTDKHRSVDDAPFGGGAGIVMKPQPFFDCLEAIHADAHPKGVYPQGIDGGERVPTILMSPDGEPFTQAIARELATLNPPRFTILCGHYEGVDERVRTALVTRTISVGDYVLTGGELPALVILDAVARLRPGVLGNALSAEEETFGADGLLEYPHYTRPAEFRGMAVPEVLLNGNHALQVRWRRQQALARTRARRPDLWAKLQPLSAADAKLLAAYDNEQVVPSTHKEQDNDNSGTVVGS